LSGRQGLDAIGINVSPNTVSKLLKEWTTPWSLPRKKFIGDLKSNGTSWQQDPIVVNDHDFASDARGTAVPCGIYDTQ
jgi:hypothetical protein